MAEPRQDRPQDSSAPPARGTSPTSPQPPRIKFGRNWIIFLLALLALNIFLGTRATKEASRVRVPYSPFCLQQVRDGHVKEITSKGTAIQGTFTQKEQYADSKPTDRFRTEIPAFADNTSLSKLLQSKGVIVNAQPLDTGSPWWQSLLLFFGPTILFVGLLFLLMRRAGNVQNILGSFGRSRASRYQPSSDRVTFKDVAGIDEAKDELSEVVDFLRRPEKYRRLGGRIPRGVLLAGPPGTGKTLLARAVAGEANAPFFSIAASEFVEAIVGVGASRVRDLFTQAKEAAPAIVFIDELDAIGRSRTSGVAGFTRDVPLAPDVDLGRIAASTPGMVGADLANLVNEAALLGARRGHDKVTEADFTDSLERIILGAERQVMMTREDRRLTAYHEGGHAIVGMLTEGIDPVRKVSIIPRGLALGVTFSAP